MKFEPVMPDYPEVVEMRLALHNAAVYAARVPRLAAHARSRESGGAWARERSGLWTARAQVLSCGRSGGRLRDEAERSSEPTPPHGFEPASQEEDPCK